MTTATMPRFIAPSKDAVRDRAPTAQAEAPEINYVGIYLSSILAVSFFFLVGVGVPLAFAMDSLQAGAALGLFTALWGGPSFGVMAGSARVSAWEEKYGSHD